MPYQIEKATAFQALHRPGNPIILFNIWDPGSAKTVEAAGAKALATGSLPVALAHGFPDGEKIPLALMLDNFRRIVSGVDVPVSIDLEGGYGAACEVVSNTVAQAVEVGAVGFNFEDQIMGGSGLYGLEEQVKRIDAARKAADGVGPSIFLNARTDMFLKAKPDTHDTKMLEEAIIRAKAFEQAGADGFFAPGLADEQLIESLCAATELPVNIIALPHVPDTETLSRLGVARISYGPVPYKRMTQWLEQEAKNALTRG